MPILLMTTCWEYTNKMSLNITLFWLLETWKVWSLHQKSEHNIFFCSNKLGKMIHKKKSTRANLGTLMLMYILSHIFFYNISFYNNFHRITELKNGWGSDGIPRGHLVHWPCSSRASYSQLPPPDSCSVSPCWRLHDHLEQHVPVLSHPHSEKVFPDAQT